MSVHVWNYGYSSFLLINYSSTDFEHYFFSEGIGAALNRGMSSFLSEFFKIEGMGFQKGIVYYFLIGSKTKWSRG